MKALILGGYGAVGATVVRELRRYGDTALAAGRDPDFSDQHTLSRELGVPVRTYFGLDSRLGTAALGVLTWVPGARRLPHDVPLPGGDGWLMLARGAGGTSRWLRGHGQSEGTALAARAAVGLDPGVRHLHHVLTLDDVAVDGALRTADAQG
ncbi:MAG: hypothetical protein ACRDT4_19445 [Micromonosporaceae bacterium]